MFHSNKNNEYLVQVNDYKPKSNYQAVFGCLSTILKITGSPGNSRLYFLYF